MITQAVIPVAGLGTRFLPATKAQSKTMFPVYDRPVVQYLVEEAVQAGIKHIIFVIDRQNQSLVQHFSPHRVLERRLQQGNKLAEKEAVSKLSRLATFDFVIQDEPRGDGEAILCAAPYLKSDEPFVVLFGDDLVHNPSGKNAVEQLLCSFKEASIPTLLVQEVPADQVSRYGIIGIEEGQNQSSSWPVTEIREKPSLEQAPSRWAIIGKYLLTPDIWDILQNQDAQPHQELGLSGALSAFLLQDKSIQARPVQGQRFDTGEPEGWLAANNHFAKAATNPSS